MGGELSLQTIEDKVEGDPLLALDLIIQYRRDDSFDVQESERLDELVKVCLLTVAGVPISNEGSLENTALEILDSPARVRRKHEMAVGLLRLLPERGFEWLGELPWRPRIVSLFDVELSYIYDKASLDGREMAHEKIDNLRTVVSSYEKEFRHSLLYLSGLEVLTKQRQKAMQVLNNRTGRELIQPFLPEDAMGKVEEVYKRAVTYVEARNSLAVVEARSRAVSACNAFIVSLDSRRTLYSCWLRDLLGRRLLEYIERDFAGNSATQPASIRISKGEKKYPFHKAMQETRLGFVIENEGPGYARDTKVVLAVGTGLRLLKDEFEIGMLPPLTTHFFEVPVRVEKPRPDVDLLLQVQWRNFDDSKEEEDIDLRVEAQRSDIDWEDAKSRAPYSLEAVTDESDLIGREDILSKLVSSATGSSVGSSIIKGQKRVGKTSIAKALRSRLEKLGYSVIFLESGDYVEPRARETVSRLGMKLSKKIIELDPTLAHLEPPNFDEALSPLSDLLDDVQRILEGRRVVIILDEFDELPFELYERSPFGNAFFLSLRSISSREEVGFVLVGGEKMDYILDNQGSHLNKWLPTSVDYFSRETNWPDYCELIERPVRDILEFSPGALNLLHETTAGNPYFTKLVCRYVFNSAIDNRDCHITAAEVEKAVKATVVETELNNFQHFWDDGIVQSGEASEEKSIRRRKILIAVSDTLEEVQPALASSIAQQPLVTHIDTLETDLKEFVARRVLVSDPLGSTYDFKVQLFRAWLGRRGVSDLIAKFTDLDVALQKRQQKEELRVKSNEIVTLLKTWAPFKGQGISEDRVRAWLEQFDSVEEQRAMFTLLQGLRYYSNEYMRGKMKEVHSIVERGLPPLSVSPNRRRRSDILVSYLDSPAKSGSQFARLYASEASIYHRNVVEKGQLVEELREREDIRRLVFIDDFVGSGGTVTSYIGDLADKIADLVLEKDIRVFLIVLVAFHEGWGRVEDLLDTLPFHVSSAYCVLLDETDQCFSETSQIFPDEAQRELALTVARRQGIRLEKQIPLGYGDFGLAVVFEHNCPNNSLPILWSESSTWRPLFKRQ